MRKSVFPLVVCLLLFAGAASADSITGVSPSTFNQFDVETTITITGTNLQGASATIVQFSGAAGTAQVLVDDPSPTFLFVSVPDFLLSEPGPVAVSVLADDGTTTRTITGGSFTVIPQSNQQPPLIGVPEQVVAEATGPSGANVTFTVTAFSYVDPGPPAISCDHASGALYPVGSTLVFCTATDSFGSSSAGFFVVVADTTAPALSLPADFVTLNPVVTYTATANDLVDGPVAVTCNPPSGSVFLNGTTLVQCTAEDAHNNLASGSFHVTVGTTPPTLTLPPNMTVEVTNGSGTPVSYTATADQSATVVCDPASGSAFPLGTTTVNCTATNALGGTSSGSFTITVVDTTPPSLSLPANITLAVPGPAVVNYTATAADIFDGDVPPVCTPPSGSSFPNGTTTVSCTATDSHNNSSSGTFTVTVGSIPPTLTLPADITREATGPGGAVVTYTATANQNATVVCNPPSGSTFPIGTTTVNCSASDLHGNTRNGSFTITVVDTTAPVIVSKSASPSTLWPPNHKMVDVAISVHAVDLVDPAPSVHIVSVSSNQPINGTGDGDTSPDWIITGPLTVQLRSERAGGNDRIYTITFVVTDSAGNSTTGTVTVTVTNQKKSRIA